MERAPSFFQGLSSSLDMVRGPVSGSLVTMKGTVRWESWHAKDGGENISIEPVKLIILELPCLDFFLCKIMCIHKLCEGKVFVHFVHCKSLMPRTKTGTRVYTQQIFYNNLFNLSIVCSQRYLDGFCML